MVVQLQELIDKIKQDGMEAAEDQARKTLDDARGEAAAIKSAANAEAEAIIANARAEAERLERSGLEALKQAGRNLLLAFRKGVEAQLDAVSAAAVAEAYSADALKKLIPETVKAWAANGSADDIAVLLPESSLNEIESALRAALKSELARGMEIRPDADTADGFKIALKDGSLYYDFSVQAVANLFSLYLNPRLSAVMQSAAKEL